MRNCKKHGCQAEAWLQPRMALVGKCPDPACGQMHPVGVEFHAAATFCEEHRYTCCLDEIITADQRKDFCDKLKIRGCPISVDWNESPMNFFRLPPENVVDFQAEKLILMSKKNRSELAGTFEPFPPQGA